MPTAIQVIEAAFQRSLKACNPDYVLDHSQAWRTPKNGFESAIGGTLRALAAYVDEYSKRYGREATVGQDGVLGDAWEQMARGLRALLNGEAGRFDCGTVDSAICDLYKHAGFEGEL